MGEKQVSEAARDVLARSRVERTILYLPSGQLARSLYEEVNEALERLGGKWKGGKVKGHVFESDPSSDLEVLIQTGLMPPKNPNAFFETPDIVQNVIFEHPRLTYFFEHPEQPLRCLEPSAGKGAIVKSIRNFFTQPGRKYTLHCCEIDPKFREGLQQQGFEVVATDFLGYTPEQPYDVIVMNPPFSIEGNQFAYITHIMHAWEMLAPDGVLIAIAPPGFTFRSDKKSREFLGLVEQNGKWEKLPSGSFTESGTGIETVILSLVKPTLQAMVERIVENSHKFTETVEQLREKITVSIHQPSKDIPVFGDPMWISRAKQKRSA